MKRNDINTVVIMLILVFASYGLGAQNTEELKSKIVKINKEMQQAMMSGTSTVGLAYYTADAVSMPNYGKMAKGIEAIKKSNEEMMASGMKINSFETSTNTVDASGKLVTELGTYKMSFSMPGSDAVLEDVGKYLTVWEKQSDGSLKIKVEIWNTDNYPMAGN